MAFGEDDHGIGDWSLEKLDYLSRYLPIYQRACMKSLQTFYIDGFAGKGQWTHRDTGEIHDGSPIRAMSIKQPRGFTKCFFVEADRSRAGNLEALLAERFPGEQYRYEVICGYFHEVLPDILVTIHPRAPIFAFIDPAGAHHFWESNVLLSKWKTELFINFPYQMTFQRLMPNSGEIHPSIRENLDRIFPTPEWFDIYQAKLKGAEFPVKAFLDLYYQGLLDLGYQEQIRPQSLKNSLGNTIYYMLWVGKHYAGRAIMESVLKTRGKQQTFGF